MVSAAAARISRSNGPSRHASYFAIARRGAAVEVTSPSGDGRVLPLSGRWSSPIPSKPGFMPSTAPGVTAASRSIYSTRRSRRFCRKSLWRRAQAGDERGGATESGFSLWPVLLGAVLILLGLELFLALRQGLPIYPIALRGAALAVLALALVNPRIFRSTIALDVILGVDLSRSVGQEGREKAQRSSTRPAIEDSRRRTGLLSLAARPNGRLCRASRCRQATSARA